MIGEYQYKDRDDVPVVLSLSLDDDGRLYELDWWKVDQPKALRHPTAHELVAVHRKKLPEPKQR
jgi:hypothetical protein